MRKKPYSRPAILSENLELRVKLAEAENMVRAIRAGEADALLIESGHGPEVDTIEGREAETNRIRSEMLAQVSDAVIATDGEGRMTYLNAAAERLYGLSGASALGRPLSDWLHCRLAMRSAGVGEEMPRDARGWHRGALVRAG